ncbi:hypothetical protein H9P43_000604 [Blastocladiella emersonii ATCC 22665]|nr:hypothetical protein H9P43_000604 [Blastocladiella emersonii ATCC 22665]
MDCENGVCQLPTRAAEPATATTTTAQTPALLAERLPWTYFQDAAGHPATLSSLRRPLTLYAFSAAWCPPCRALAPTLAAVHHNHHETDVDLVYVGLEYSRAEHEEKNLLPYFRFGWTGADLPADLPADCENPHWASHWATVKALGKLGIPTAIVVDAATGKIVEDAVDLVLANQPTAAQIARAVATWRSGRAASTWWMRTRYWLTTRYYMSKFKLTRFFTEWLLAPLRKLITAAPAAGTAEKVAEETKTKEVEVAAEAEPLLAATEEAAAEEETREIVITTTTEVVEEVVEEVIVKESAEPEVAVEVAPAAPAQEVAEAIVEEIVAAVPEEATPAAPVTEEVVEVTATAETVEAAEEKKPLIEEPAAPEPEAVAAVAADA